jgi:hypothetical protein
MGCLSRRDVRQAVFLLREFLSMGLLMLRCFSMRLATIYNNLQQTGGFFVIMYFSSCILLIVRQKILGAPAAIELQGVCNRFSSISSPTQDQRRNTNEQAAMKTPIRTITLALAAAIPNFASAATYFDFSGINGPAVFSVAGQNFVQSGALTGYILNVKGSFQPSGYNGSYQVSSSNLSGPPYENPAYNGAPGIFFRYLPDAWNGSNLTAKFDVTFTWTGPANLLKLAAFSAESVDREQDSLVTSGTNWGLQGAANVDSVVLSGNSGVITEANDQPGVGSYALVTDFASGSGTVSWTYDYLAPPPIFSGGANMIGFSAQTAPVIPEPSTHALVVSLALLGAAVRRRPKA